MRLVVFAFVVSLTSAACVREPYRHTEPAQFRSAAPQALTFDRLVRHAMGIGYVLAGADPARGVFHVHSRVMGRPPRPGRMQPSPLRASLFEVQIRDDDVRVTAIGRHVAPDGSMHPTLAQELDIFADSLQRAAETAQLAPGGTIPAPPSTYGEAPLPGSAPPSYDAEPASAHPPPRYGARPAEPAPPAHYDRRPASPAPPPTYESPHSDAPVPSSPARRLGRPTP